MTTNIRLEELTTVEISRLIREGWTTVIVPLGATEQHGPALPLLVDNEHGLQTAFRAARKVGRTLVGPVVTLGCSDEHSYFAGTISLSHETMCGVIRDVAGSLARSGFRLIYFWIAHGGNNAALQMVLPEIACKWPGCRVVGLRDVSNYIEKTWDRAPIEKQVPLAVSGSHAGEFETSIMLAARPELVRMEQAQAGNPAPLATVLDQMMREGIHTVSANGVLGDQRAADASRGDYYLHVLGDFLAGELQKELALTGE
jgi:creatinine amidohydrolase